jgi:hypothetical protein
MAFKRVTEEERRLVSYWRSKPFTPSSQQLTQAIEEPAPARLHPVCRNLTIDCTPVRGVLEAQRYTVRYTMLARCLEPVGRKAPPCKFNATGNDADFASAVVLTALSSDRQR